MILSSAILAAALWATPARAQEDAPSAEAPADAPDEAAADEEEDPLSAHRSKFDVLADRAIGTTSKPVQFNWRRSTVQVAVTGSHMFELNNFNSLRAGAMARLPTGAFIVELGANYARVWDTPSSELLALTPYRQPGRPSRIELDFAVGIPLAEGVVTTFPRFFPAVQMVFNAYAGVRYAIYPTGYANMKVGQVAGAIFAPSMSEIELENLDDARLDAMQLDPGRYAMMVGFGNDLYFKQGIFLSPRLVFAVPLLAPATQTNLLWWADISLAIGVAF